MSSAVGQTWTKIGDTPQIPGTAFCAYFWDSAHGVVAGAGFIETYNAGTWTQPAYPEKAGNFTSLRLFDPTHLYASSGTTDVWVSSDQGATWKLSGLGSKAVDVFKNKLGQIVPIGVAPYRFQTNVCGLDQNNILLMTDDGVGPLYSLDGGITWDTAHGLIRGNGGYGCYADTCLNAYLITKEDGEVWSSIDSGRTFHPCAGLIPEDDVFEGCDGVLFAQSRFGIYASIDLWSTAKLIFGPANSYEDIHMFPFGPRGRYLVAFVGKQVWMCTGAGDGLALPDILVARDTTVQNCSLSSLSVSIVASSIPRKIHIAANGGQPGQHILPADTTIMSSSNGPTVITFRIQPPGIYAATDFQITASMLDGCNPISSQKFVSVWPKPGELIPIVPDTVVSLCQSYQLPVILTSTFCDTLVYTLDSVRVVDSSAEVVIASARTDTLLPGGSATVLLNALPRRSGACEVLLFVHAFGLHNNARLDSVVHVPFVCIANVGGYPVVSAPDSILASSCDTTTIAIPLQNFLCDSIEFARCDLQIDASLQWNTNVSGPRRSAAAFPLSIAAQTVDTLWLRFPAQNASGKHIVKAHLTGRYAGLAINFDTTVQFQIEFAGDVPALAGNTGYLELPPTSTCQSKDTTILFTNRGCFPIIVTKDTTQWQPGWSATDPVFPITIAKDSSFVVKVHYAPHTASGPVIQSLSYVFDAPGKTDRLSYEVLVRGTAVAGPAIAGLPDTLIDLGTLPLCHTDSTVTIRLTNLGCDTLLFSSVRLDSLGSFTLVSGSDTSVAPDSGCSISVRFRASASGSYRSRLHVFVASHGGAPHDTSITFIASVGAGSSAATLSTNVIDFGTTSLCEERDSIIKITNTGCDTLRIDSARGSNNQFALADSIHFPIILPPKTSASLPVLTHLDTTGHPSNVTNSLVLFSSSDVPLPPITLSRSISYPVHFALVMSAEDSARVSASVPIYILRKGTLPNEATSVGFDLVYDENVLEFVSPVQNDIQTTGAKLLTNGLTDRTFAMKPASDRDTIATLTFRSYLAQDDRTSIALLGQNFYAGGTQSPPCVAAIDTAATASNFSLELICGEGAIRNSLGDLPIDMTSMQVENQSLTFTLCRNSSAPQSCVAEILNVMGQSATSEKLVLAPGNNQMVIDVSQLPSGTYFLRLASISRVISRAFSVVR